MAEYYYHASITHGTSRQANGLLVSTRATTDINFEFRLEFEFSLEMHAPFAHCHHDSIWHDSPPSVSRRAQRGEHRSGAGRMGCGGVGGVVARWVCSVKMMTMRNCATRMVLLMDRSPTQKKSSCGPRRSFATAASDRSHSTWPSWPSERSEGARERERG